MPTLCKPCFHSFTRNFVDWPSVGWPSLDSGSRLRTRQDVARPRPALGSAACFCVRAGFLELADPFGPRFARYGIEQAQHKGAAIQTKTGITSSRLQNPLGPMTL